MRTALTALLLCLAAPLTAQAGEGSLLVLNKSGHDASFIDPDSGETWLTLPTGRGPHEVAVSPDGRLAVVANYGAMEGGRFAPGNTLTVYDLQERAVAKTIDLGEHRAPHGVQFLADGRRLVATSEADQHLLVVDVEAGEVVQAIPTRAAASHMVVVSPDERRAFVANIGPGTVSVLDLEQGEHLATIATGAGCEGIDVTPDGKQVWTTNRAADTLSVIDTESLEVVAEIPSASFPIRIKITPDGQRAIVTNAASGEIAVFDVAERKELARIPIPLDVVDKAGERLFGANLQGSVAPVGVLVHPDGARAYIANTNADVVTVVDLATLELVGGFRAGKEPDGLGWVPVTARDEG